MKRKLMGITLAGLMVLSLGTVGALAEDAAPVPTASQEKLVQLHDEMMELQKERLDQFVAAGLMTQVQAELAKKQMELRGEYLKANGFAAGPAFGMGQGNVGPGNLGRRGVGRGMMAGGRMGFGGRQFGYAQATAPELTEAQQQELVKLHKERLELRKSQLDEYVAAGLMTQAQAELAKKQIELRQEYLEANGWDAASMPGMGMGVGPMGGFNGGMMRGHMGSRGWR